MSAPASLGRHAPPVFGGVDHVALTVTDLDRSQRFYAEVLDFVVVMDIGTGRICLHPQTGFVLALLAHPGGHDEPFSELHVGTDHLGFSARSREELELWQARFRHHGVPHTPIRDEIFGAHLNFRDPDDIALEFSTSNDLMLAARATMAAGHTSASYIAAFVTEHVGADFVPSEARARV